MPGSLEEAQSRSTSVLSVCEHEVAAIEELEDPRLAMIAERIHAFRLDLIAALEGLDRPLASEDPRSNLPPAF